jgi:heme a synthase
VRLPRLSPSAYRRITYVALLALAFIIVTGGAVRLTGSGLGCPDWPTCEQDRLVAPLEYHAMVEFVNRTVTGVVSIAVIAAVLGSLLRVPRRRDLVWLSLGLVGGVVGQIVLGGLTVLFHLWPPLVMGHFVLSMLLVWNGVVLHRRASQREGPARLVVSPEQAWHGRLVVAAAGLVVLTGTVVTASGPHGGDADVDRLPFLVPDVARIHGIAVVLLVGLVIATVVQLRRSRAPEATWARGQVLLVVLFAQAGVGYTQYFTGVPVVLVGIHIAGAVAVWAAALRFHLGLWDRGAEPEPAEVVAPAPRSALARA